MAADVTVLPTASSIDSDLSGLDALDLAGRRRQAFAVRAWRSAWPKLLAIGIALLIWQSVVWSGWKPSYVLPGPGPVFADLWHGAGTVDFWSAIGTTLRRAVTGFALAVVIGSVIGLAVSRSRTLRAATGSLITGLQTMPSIAWFPLAILLFQLSERAILFVVVLGAAPSIANGVLAGVDYVPPLLLRAGRNLGAEGLMLYRLVVAPASVPAILAGLKQGWAFAWRSLMAGELLVILANRPSLGVRLQFDRELNDTPALLATMIVILIIGVIVDTLFGVADGAVRRNRGVAEAD